MRDPLLGHLSGAVTAIWANAVPTIAQIALWARGDLAPVYAVADALPPVARPGMLAWLAALDPEATAPRVLRAAREALAHATFHDELAVVALVPLDDPDIAQLARRKAHSSDRNLLDLREDRDAPAPESYGHHLYKLFHAACRADHGQRDDDAITAALAGAITEPAVERAMIPTVRRLDAWDLLPKTGWSSGSHNWLAFVAGRVGPPAIDRLVEHLGDPTLLVPAVLGAGHVDDAWRPALAGLERANFEELHADGLISRDEEWTYRLGPVLAGPDAYASTDALILHAIADVHASAGAFADELTAGWTPSPRDERLAHEVQRLDKLAAALTDERPDHRSLRRLRRPAFKLADHGAASEVRRVLDALERRWGPALAWFGRSQWGASFELETLAELLSCAEGRAREALELDTPSARLDAPTRVRICAGLAREGHTDVLADPFERLLGERHEPADVVLLARAALALAPEAEPTYRDALARTLSALPASPAEARAWLAACDRASLRRARA